MISRITQNSKEILNVQNALNWRKKAKECFPSINLNKIHDNFGQKFINDFFWGVFLTCTTLN